MAQARARLSESFVEFASSGVSIFVGTRDAALIPDCAFVAGLRAHQDRTRATLYLPIQSAARSLENLSANPQVAVVLSHPRSNRTMQLKGNAASHTLAPEADRAFVEACRQRLAEVLTEEGMPKEVGMSLNVWPAVAVELEILEVFDQTPGPQAGKAIDLA